LFKRLRVTVTLPTFLSMKSNAITKRQLSDWILATLRESAWAPLGVIGFYIVGLALDWFDLYPPLDIPTHFVGGVAITYFYRSAIYHSQRVVGEIPLSIQVILAFTCTGTTIIFWEFYENILDFLFNAHNVLGVADTVRDMFVGLLGALMLSLFYRRR
ncbi:MAG TPA: hypothetical protein VJ785_05565, partial [Anaerolineales bacterium]|nr:hypothetical protein [Anaerolineales bacterium]